MNAAMIAVAPDVLTRLLTLRRSETESLDEILRRVLPPAAKTALISAERGIAATPSANGGGVSYLLDGEVHAASDATEAMINIPRDLAQYDDDFFPKLAAKVRGRTRNHVAQSRWFSGCNIANREKKRILRAACDVMGLVFDRDIKIDLVHA